MLEGFIERLGRVRTLEGLNAIVVGLRDALDIDHVVYHSVNSTGEQYAALTYSPDWVDQYLVEDYARVDPVVQGCLRRFHPVDWGQLDWTSRSAKQFRGEASASGIGGQGLSVPIRGPSGQFALFTVSAETGDDTWARFAVERTGEVILASHFINEKALELERGSDTAPVAALSPREVDALTLLATGKSRAQAADNLSISEHTLRVYIESARFKLAAANTTHAVARALSQGLLLV